MTRIRPPQVPIRLTDGPAQGAAHYFSPLPKTLVVPVKNPDTRYHDYHRQPDTADYHHAPSQ